MQVKKISTIVLLSWLEFKIQTTRLRLSGISSIDVRKPLLGFYCFYVLLTSLIFKRFLFSSLYSTKLIKFHDKTGQFHSHECLTSTSFIISLFMLSIQNRRWRLPPLPLFHFSFMHMLHCVQLNQLTVCAHDQTFRVLVERLCANKVAYYCW